MLSPITLIFGSQWTVPNFIYQSLMTELDFQTGRDQEGSGFISCVTRRDSVVGLSIFDEMARKGR
jgi:hypothetical protein